MFDIVGTAAQYRSSDFRAADGREDVQEGTTVEVAKDYPSSQGQEGRVYRYIVKSPEGSGGSISTPLDLRTQNYKDTDKWQLVDKLKVSILKERKWAVTAPDGRSYVLELNEAGTSISISRQSINAVSSAASLAAAIGGSAGIAVSGAGALSQNVVLTNTNACADGSVLDSADDITITATSTSTISSMVIAASLGIGGGGAAGVGASIGVAVAHNFIGWTPDRQESPAQVQAYLQNSSANTAGDILLASSADQRIQSVVFAGSVAIAAAGTAGFGVSEIGRAHV